MEVQPDRGPLHHAGADHEVAEMFAVVTIGGIGGEQRRQGGNDRGVVHVAPVQLAQPRAIVRAAEIQVV